MHRKRYRPEVVVGLFGIATFLIIIYMSRKVDDAPFVSTAGVRYNAYFDSVSGLIPKTPVETAGISVGYVESIELDGTRARLTLNVSSEIPVYDDAVVSIQGRGILGDKFVSLNPGTLGRKRLNAGDFIPNTRSGGEIGALMESLGKTAATIEELAANLNTLVTDNTTTVNRILVNIDEFTGQLSHLSNDQSDLSELMANLNEASRDLKRFAREGLNEHLTHTAKKLDDTIGALNRVVDKIDRGEGTIGRLVNDESTIDHINSALEGVEEFTKGLGRIRTDIRYRGEYLVESGELQNMVSLTVRPRPDKYFRFELVDAVQGETKVVDTTIESPAGTPISATRTIQTDDNIVFSLEMAKRFYDATFRFGVIRNEGGFGLDYHLFDDMLTLSAEFFDFGRYNNNLHARGYASLNLWRYLILTAGVDDIFNDVGNKNPFFGAGISFNDDDVKTLIGVVSTAGANM